jgi:MFS family permease
MYLSTARPGASTRGGRAVGANVIALGLVSCFTDISSEMVTAILPAYLVLGLHLSLAQYGVVDGLYTGATGLTRLAGAYVADRFRRRKLVAGIGYGMSALSKAGLLLAGAAPGAIGAVLLVDRAGKGLRTAPRDALITLSSPAAHLGRAFGVHRTLDSLGAFAGPLVAIGVLAIAAAPQRYDAVFVASFCAALIGMVLLALLVRDREDPRPATAISIPQAFRLLSGRDLRRVGLAALLLGVGTVGDGFVYLILQRRDDLQLTLFPALAIGTNLAYLLLATPLGYLADRIGRRWVYLAGHVALLTVYLLLAAGRGPLPLILGLYGAFYAATDGILMALAGPLLPPELRSSGLAYVQTLQAVAYLVSSIVFGVAWQSWGVATACLLAAGVVVVCLPVSAVLLRGRAS